MARIDADDLRQALAALLTAHTFADVATGVQRYVEWLSQD